MVLIDGSKFLLFILFYDVCKKKEVFSAACIDNLIDRFVKIKKEKINVV